MSQIFRSTPVDLRQARYLRIDLARSRVRIVHAEIRFEDEQSEFNVVGDVKSVDGTVLLVQLDPEVHRGVRAFQLRVDVAYGRAIPAFVTVFGVADGQSKEIEVVRTGSIVVPDWIADRATFTERFGVVGARRRSAFEIPVEFVWVQSDLHDLIEAVRKYPIRLGPFDVDGARGSAAEVVCAIGKYFRRLEYLTTDPGAGSAGFATLPELTEARNILQQELISRAAYGTYDKNYTITATGSTWATLVQRIDAVTKVFEDAETLLPNSVPGATPFEWAYELFVSGRLAIAHSNPNVHWRIMHHGAPDGVPFLLFAQLASNAIATGTRVDFWAPRFAALVRAATLFQAFPASDAARANEYFVDDALPDDHYAFYDGKTIPLRLVFEMRRRHQQHLAGKSTAESLDQLERALTWVAARLVQPGTIEPDSGAGPLNVPDLLLVPTPPPAP